MQPTRLEDYRAPDFAIDKVEINFVLHPTATKVTAALTIRPVSDDAVPLRFGGRRERDSGLAPAR